jgi:hypothetical protein
MLRKYTMNSNFLRNMGLISFDLDNYSDSPGNFTPYFRYEIGRYQDDFILYFPKQPNPKQYYNYIFLKLWAYNPQDAIKYIEYHYADYPDKKDFLLFMKRQLQYRSARAKQGGNLLSIATISLDWVDEELNHFKDRQKIVAYNQFIRQDLTFIVKNELQHVHPASETSSDQSVDHITERISSGLQAKLDSILENTESKIMALADKYETSNIQLTNANMKDKLIGLFLCLKELTGKPARGNKSADSLFSKMDLNDIAQILRLNFGPYKGLKIDSIERRVYEVNTKFKSDNPVYQDLAKALQKYFFNAELNIRK